MSRHRKKTRIAGKDFAKIQLRDAVPARARALIAESDTPLSELFVVPMFGALWVGTLTWAARLAFQAKGPTQLEVRQRFDPRAVAASLEQYFRDPGYDRVDMRAPPLTASTLRRTGPVLVDTNLIAIAESVAGFGYLDWLACDSAKPLLGYRATDGLPSALVMPCGFGEDSDG